MIVWKCVQDGSDNYKLSTWKYEKDMRFIIEMGLWETGKWALRINVDETGSES
jgi:hypothetical protein